MKNALRFHKIIAINNCASFNLLLFTNLGNKISIAVLNCKYTVHVLFLWYIFSPTCLFLVQNIGEVEKITRIVASAEKKTDLYEIKSRTLHSRICSCAVDYRPLFSSFHNQFKYLHIRGRGWGWRRYTHEISSLKTNISSRNRKTLRCRNGVPWSKPRRWAYWPRSLKPSTTS